jgi:hypothetical protein
MTRQSRSSTSSSEYGDEGYEPSDDDKRNAAALSGDEEKAIGLDGTEHAATEKGESGLSRVGQGQSKRLQDGRSLRTTRSHHSRAGGDGYTCFDAEPDNDRPNNSNSGVVTEQPYLVTWDGDADPENPRSMSNLRRWTIVLICSASSLCV